MEELQLIKSKTKRHSMQVHATWIEIMAINSQMQIALDLHLLALIPARTSMDMC